MTASLFRVVAFRNFWLARLLGMAANQMLLVALAWQMYDLTGSAMDLGLVGLIQFLPALVLTLPAGQAADRWPRTRIVAGCLLAQLAAALLLVLAIPLDLLGRDLLFLVSLILGVVRAFQMPAQQALLPALVKDEQLSAAIALGSSAMQVAIIGGPAIGGLVYVFGAIWVYGLCALAFALATLFMLGVSVLHRPARGGMSLREALAGLSYLWGNKVMLGAVSLDLFAVLLGGATALLPIYARDILHAGPEALGFLRAAPAIGALAMSLALVRWPLHRRVGIKMLLSVIVFGLATLVFALSGNLWLSLAALAITGAADSISVVVRLTLVQLETPDAIRGRVSAVNSIFIGASNQLGEFESGATAALLGPVGSVVLGGIGTVLVALAWMRLFPALLARDRLHPERP